MKAGLRPLISLVASAVATVAISAQVAVMASQHNAPPTPVTSGDGPQATGTVVDEHGTTVAGVAIMAAGEQTTSGRDGRFSLPLERPALAHVSAGGHLSRTIALEPDTETTIPLTSGSMSTVSLRVGGDVMLGRHYYEARKGAGAVLSPSSTDKEHADVFGSIEPLLKDADITAVTLAMPLLADPSGVGIDPQRRPDLHPTKPDLRAGSTQAAGGLALSGIDVVSLANENVMDGLDAGLASTIDALDKAGVGHFGAGRTVDEAWQPALLWTRGQAVAFIGCTTVTEDDTTIPVVADDGRAGAAECDTERLPLEIAKARLTAATVVVMLHGGRRGQRSQLPDVREYAQIARESGAGVVVGSHPGVAGGISGDDSALFSESLGNLAHDEASWASLPAALLRVDVRQGKPVAASTDPIVLDEGRPRPALGTMAESVARIVAGWTPGPARLAGPGARAGFPASTRPARAAVTLKAGAVRRFSSGWWYDAPAGDSPLRTGRDLLFGTGDFERMELGRDSTKPPLWTLGASSDLSTDAACGPGKGIMMARTPLSTEPAITAPDLRTPVTPGGKLTLLAEVRQASEGSRLEIHWYRAMQGPSSDITTILVPTGSWTSDSCRSITNEVTVPEGAVAAKVYVKLPAPAGGQLVRRLAVDNVALVEWSQPGQGGRRDDYITSTRGAYISLVADDRFSAGTKPLR